MTSQLYALQVLQGLCERFQSRPSSSPANSTANLRPNTPPQTTPATTLTFPVGANTAYQHVAPEVGLWLCPDDLHQGSVPGPDFTCRAPQSSTASRHKTGSAFTARKYGFR